MPTPAKIVFFGTSRFAVPSLRALAAKPEVFEVQLVVSQPDRPVGRKAELTPPPVAVAAKELGLPLYQPAKLRDGEAQRQLAALKPDAFVVAAYGRILPQDLLDIPRRGALNLHGSILPRHRGASPIQAAILNGDRESGVSLMLMDAELDHGPVLDTVRTPLTGNETFTDLERTLGDVAATLIAGGLSDFLDGRSVPQEQDHAAATHTGLIGKNDGAVIWSRDTATDIERKIRAYDPWPGVFAVWQHGGKKLRLRLLKTAATEQVAAAGLVTMSADGFPVVGTKKGAVKLLVLQAEGKNAQPGDVFVRGHQDFVDSTLFDGI